MITEVDLVEAKAALSRGWLERAQAAGVVGMRPLRHRPSAEARAGYSVHGFGIGRKTVKHRVILAPAVTVYVVQKLPRLAIPLASRLPTSIDGVPVDVVESPAAFLTISSGGDAPIRNGALAAGPGQTAVSPGLSTGRLGTPPGTLAACCRSTRPNERGIVLALSNNHVLAALGGQRGDPICQPAPGDAGGVCRKIGGLWRAYPIEPGTLPNLVDCAVARLDDSVAHQSVLPTIGDILGTDRAQLDAIVCKYGRTTGYTEGIVRALDCTEVVGLDQMDKTKTAIFANQIRVDARNSVFASKGDSGSLVLAKGTGRGVGLYFAGPPGGSYGLANHLGIVRERLDLDLLTAR